MPGKSIGMERVVVETVNSMVKVVPPTLVRAVGKKVRELVALNRDSDERRVPRTVYTDLTYAVLTKNTDLIEKLLI